jgi:hypothetical protein
MSELNLIIPCCFGKYCYYNSGFSDGYVLGILTMFMLYVFIEIMNNISDRYAFKEEEKEEETEKEEKPEEEEEAEEEEEEKPEEDKKDD